MSKRIESIAKNAAEDPHVLSALLDGILSKKDAVRYGNFKALFLLSQEHPEVLFPKWDFFVNMLDSENTYHRCIAVRIIANLIKADSEMRFEKIFDRYYSLLDDPSVVTANYLAAVSGKITLMKPRLQTEITKKLLSIDETHHTTQRRDLIKSYIITSFKEYFQKSDDKPEILEFVKKQLSAKSPKTVGTAKQFLKETAS